MRQRADLQDGGYGRLSCTLVDALASADLTKQEYKVVWTVFRATYCVDAGRNKGDEGPKRLSKSFASLSGAQIGKYAGLDRSDANRAIKHLLEKGVLRRKGDEIGLNPKVSEWTISGSGSGTFEHLGEGKSPSVKAQKSASTEGKSPSVEPQNEGGGEGKSPSEVRGNHPRGEGKSPSDRGEITLTHTPENTEDKSVSGGSLDSRYIDNVDIRSSSSSYMRSNSEVSEEEANEKKDFLSSEQREVLQSRAIQLLLNTSPSGLSAEPHKRLNRYLSLPPPNGIEAKKWANQLFLSLKSSIEEATAEKIAAPESIRSVALVALSKASQAIGLLTSRPERKTSQDKGVKYFR